LGRAGRQLCVCWYAKLGKTFPSASPRAGLLDDFEDEVQLNEWWKSFDGLLMPYREEVNGNW
jgi:hypothetical protein